MQIVVRGQETPFVLRGAKLNGSLDPESVFADSPGKPGNHLFELSRFGFRFFLVILTVRKSFCRHLKPRLHFY